MADEEVKQEAESTETPETQTESQTESQTQTEEKAECQENSTEQTEAPAEEPKELTPEEKIAELEKENADLKDQLLRRAADFDNYRKRMIKEKQETFDYANANLLADLLESLDNFDRTVEASATATDVKTIVDGIKMVKGSLVQMLENKYGLASYAVEGDEFDPTYTSGMYKGENKFMMLLKRNTPIWHSIYMLERLDKNNKTYKLDENMLSIIPVKKIAEYIKD